MEITFEDAVRYAARHLDDDRNVVRLTQNYLSGGWWPPDPPSQEKLRKDAIAAVAEARRPTRGKGDGRATFA
jgi:hypothetical protein